MESVKRQDTEALWWVCLVMGLMYELAAVNKCAICKCVSIQLSNETTNKQHV